MLTKEYIAKLKTKGNGDLKKLIAKQISEKDVNFILENLGHLPDNFDETWVVDLLNSKNNKIRLNAVKTLGKVKNPKYIERLLEIAKTDPVTEIRREAVSSIGRMRDKRSVYVLLELLNDYDPKVVMQAIRALLIFKGDKKIDDELKKLVEHENEMIQMIINKEYFPKNGEKKDKLKHSESYDFLKNVVVNGDVRDVLKLIPDESFHLTFTSPPYYNARDYSIYRVTRRI